MRKKILLAFTFLFIFVMAIAMIACTDYEQDQDEPSSSDETTTVERVITNGTFYNATSTNNDGVYDTITSWTKNSAGLTAPSAGADLSTGVFSGVVDMSSTTFESLLAQWVIDTKEGATSDDGTAVKLADEEKIALANPGIDSATPKKDKVNTEGKVIVDDQGNNVQVNEDTKALMLASTLTTGSHYVSSSSYSLDADSLYRLQFSVCSVSENKNSGAFVYIRGDMEYEYKAINTDGKWVTYVLYIETNRSETLSLSFETWLGYGPVAGTGSYEGDNQDRYATRGIALFDNFICKKVVDEVKTDAKEIAFKDIYPDYQKDENDADYIHTNYEKFATSSTVQSVEKDNAGNYVVDAVSSYYLEDANLAVRSHLTSSSYFSASSSNRSYFYSFRDYSTSNINSTFWKLNSDCDSSADSSLSSSYYGVVNPANLYKVSGTEEKTYTSTYTSITAMSSENWLKSFINTSDKVYDFASLDEQQVLMLYNTSLRASGYKSSKTILVDANAYYAISVWTYVWAEQYEGSKSYNNDVSYIKAFSESEDLDPTDDSNTTYTASQKAIYKLYSTEVMPEGYFAPASTTAFDSTIFKTDDIYNDVLAEIYTWLNGKGIELESSDNQKALSKLFFYSYLYYCYNGEIAGTAYDKSTLDACFATGTDADTIANFFEYGWKQERATNLDTAKTVKTAYDSYKTKHDAWLEKKSAYNTQAENWELNNPNGPSAIIRLTGAGEGIEEKTTAIGEWQKITIYVQGNQLSSRGLTLNLIFGETSDTNKQMVGGVFFDNIEIERLTEKDPSKKWHVLSEITKEEEISFGGLNVDKGASAPSIDAWTVKTAEGTSPADVVSVKAEKDETIKTVAIDAKEYDLYVLNYSNETATASTLFYNGNNVVKILPNKYYRFAFLIKTIDVDEDLGITVDLLKSNENVVTADNSSSFSSFSSYSNNTDEWKEVAYYIVGDLIDSWYLSLKVTMGSGTRLTPEEYIKGSVKLSAFNLLEIDYDEYTDAKTGDKITSSLSLYSISNSISSTSTVDNGTYSKIDYSNTDKEQFDQTTGELIGVAKPSDWTKGTALNNGFDEIKYDSDITKTNLSYATESNKYVLSWTAVTGDGSKEDGTYKSINPDAYEIWVKYDDDGTDVEKLYDIVDLNGEGKSTYKYTINQDTTAWKTCAFAVKAVSSEAIGSLSASSYVTLPFGGAKKPECVKAYADSYKLLAGTRLVKNVEKLYKVDGFVYGEDYYSDYPTVLEISSDYLSAIKMTSSSYSLSSDTFYKISIWAKTVNGAKATIALTSAGGSLTADVNESIIGYDTVSTDGTWKEYSFYVKTNANFSSSVSVNLCLGNPFANKKPSTDEDDVEYYASEDLSTGTVYFDAVRFVTIDESTYNAIKGLNDKKTVEYAVVENTTENPNLKLLYTTIDSYIYIMEYVIDSFDSPTVVSTDADKLGNTPVNYDWQYNSDKGKSTTNGTYGVYNISSTSTNMQDAIKYLYTNEVTENSIKTDKLVYNDYFSSDNCIDSIVDFSTAWTDTEWNTFVKNMLDINRIENGELVKDGGNNVLVMSNKLATGYEQYYSLSSGYSHTMKKGTYYKFSFSANTLIAVPQYTQSGSELARQYYEQGSWATHCTEFYTENGVQIAEGATYDSTKDYRMLTYSMENAYGFLRFTSGETDAKDLDVYISSYEKGAKYISTTDMLAKTYTIYLYNPEDGNECTASWAFHLGYDGDNDDTTLLNQFVVGIMAIDLVSMEEIDKDAYDAGIAGIVANYDADGKIINEKASTLKYEYCKAEDTDDDTDDDGDTDDDDTEDEKDDFWTNLVNDQYFWLYISSFVLALIIIVVVIVVVVRNFKKKHPREVIVENVVKTEKDIKIVEPEHQEKEEALESDEYVDEIKPVYIQRTVAKKKKNKNKKK